MPVVPVATWAVAAVIASNAATPKDTRLLRESGAIGCCHDETSL